MIRTFCCVGVLLAIASAATAANMPALSAYPPSSVYAGISLTQTGGDITLSDRYGYSAFAVGYASPSAAGFGDDYLLGTTLDWTDTTTELGLMARADLTSKNLYYAGVNPNNRYFIICKVVGGGTFKNIAAVELGTSVFDVTGTYSLAFGVSSANLFATLKNSSGTQIASLSGTDDQNLGDIGCFSTGTMGVFEVQHTNRCQGDFLGTTINAVPEPGSLTVIVTGMIGFALYALRRERSA